MSFVTNKYFIVGVIVGFMLPWVLTYVKGMIGRGGKGQGDY